MKALIEFHNELIEIYGYTLQVGIAISNWRDWVNQLVNSSSGTTLSNTVSFGPDAPNLPDAKYQYRATVGDLITASGPVGINSILHRRYILVLVVAAWEDHYRGRIARECNLVKDDVKSAVFGDLNKYRRAILHARSKLASKPEVLPYFCKGDEVSPTFDQVDSIFRALVDELNRLGREYYHTDPELVFGGRLNNAAQTIQ